MKNGTEEGEENIPGLRKSTCKVTKTRNSMTSMGNYTLLEDNKCPIYLPGWFQGSVEWMYTLKVLCKL